MKYLKIIPIKKLLIVTISLIGMYLQAQTTTDKNYVQTVVHGKYGQKIGESIQYYDNLGKPTQSIKRDFAKDLVVASELVYDDFGRVEKTTLPAPVDQQDLRFISSLLEESGDGMNDVQRYYSSNNTDEPFVPECDEPYSKVEYSQTIPGAVKKSYLVGTDKYSSGFTVSAAPEEISDLDFLDYVDLNTLKVATASSNPISDFQGMTKSVTKDVMGKEAVTYINAEGQVIATAMVSQMSVSRTLNISNSFKTDGVTGYVDFHLPEDGLGDYTITRDDSWEYDLISLETDEVVASGYGTASGIPPGFYRMVCLKEYQPDDEVSIFYTVSPLKYFSFYAYDEAGRLIRSISPKDVEEIVDQAPTGDEVTQMLEERVPQNTYGALGRLTGTYSRDNGLTKFAYRQDGSIRCSQNAEQRKTDRVSYTNYDEHGRVVEVGEYEATSSPNDIIDTYSADQALLEQKNAPGDGFNNDAANSYYQTYTQYDGPDASCPRSQKFLRGRVSKSWNDNSVTWYSYNYDGTVDWVVKKLNNFDLNSDGTVDLNDCIALEYTYDFVGNVTQVTYQLGDKDEFNHFYEYDTDQRLVAVYTNSGAASLIEDYVLNSGITENTTIKASKSVTLSAGFNSNGYKFSAEVTTEEPKILQAKYYYYRHGPLKRTEIADNLQGIDYVYTIQGWLKSINNPLTIDDPGGDGSTGHPGFGEDIFALNLDYFSNDYIRDNTGLSNTRGMQYDGNIAIQTWVNKGLGPVSASSQAAYSYTYDDRGYLQSASFGNIDPSGQVFSPSDNPRSAYKVGCSYDNNGNLQALQRYHGINEANTTALPVATVSTEETDALTNPVEEGTPIVATLIDDFTYHYISGTNRLEYISDTKGKHSYVGDLGNQLSGNYTYNDIGQLTTDNYGKSGAGHRFAYDVYGKVTSVHDGSDSPVAQYEYDEQGLRIKKTDNSSGKVTWYVRDINGNIISTYETISGSTGLAEIPVYGPGRIGMARVVNGEVDHYTYELTDHQGNVRATFTADGNDSGTEPDILYAADYYPFGMIMPKRQYTSESYRFGYQGQYAEKDEETGYEQFELRLYDSRIGRWMTTDPYGQYWSPYLAMGNNPVSGIDPDGGYKGGFMDFFFDHDYWKSQKATIRANKGILSLDGDINPDRDNYYAYIAKEGSVGARLNANPEIFSKAFEKYGWCGYTRSLSRAMQQDFVANSGLTKLMTIYMQTVITLPLGGAGAWAPEITTTSSRFVTAFNAAKGATGEFYSVAYEMKLASSSYPGVYRGAHFLEANKALSATIGTDARFASSMSELGVTIPRSPTGAILGRSPVNWVWHHDIGAGVMQLVPKAQHTIGSSFWGTLHPNGLGGFAIWGK